MDGLLDTVMRLIGIVFFVFGWLAFIGSVIVGIVMIPQIFWKGFASIFRTPGHGFRNWLVALVGGVVAVVIGLTLITMFREVHSPDQRQHSETVMPQP